MKVIDDTQLDESSGRHRGDAHDTPMRPAAGSPRRGREPPPGAGVAAWLEEDDGRYAETTGPCERRRDEATNKESHAHTSGARGRKEGNSHFQPRVIYGEFEGREVTICTKCSRTCFHPGAQVEYACCGRRVCAVCAERDCERCGQAAAAGPRVVSLAAALGADGRPMGTNDGDSENVEYASTMGAAEVTLDWDVGLVERAMAARGEDNSQDAADLMHWPNEVLPSNGVAGPTCHACQTEPRHCVISWHVCRRHGTSLCVTTRCVTSAAKPTPRSGDAAERHACDVQEQARLRLQPPTSSQAAVSPCTRPEP